MYAPNTPQDYGSTATRLPIPTNMAMARTPTSEGSGRGRKNHTKKRKYAGDVQSRVLSAPEYKALCLGLGAAAASKSISATGKSIVEQTTEITGRRFCVPIPLINRLVKQIEYRLHNNIATCEEFDLVFLLRDDGVTLSGSKVIEEKLKYLLIAVEDNPEQPDSGTQNDVIH
jgi:hypothetical protein